VSLKRGKDEFPKLKDKEKKHSEKRKPTKHPNIADNIKRFNILEYQNKEKENGKEKF
jgi:hypothetical protein